MVFMRGRLLLAFAAFTGVAGTHAHARAQMTEQCLAASEDAQQLRRIGKLEAAVDRLAVCSAPECPALVRADCTQWTKEALDALPSVVPGAKDADGRDRANVTLSIDGRRVTDVLDGRPIPVDPGIHVFRYEAAGSVAVEQQMVIRAGEKNRVIVVTLAPQSAARATIETPPAEPSPPIAAYVAGGIGIAALAVGLVLDLDANGRASTLRASCAPNCAKDDVDSIEGRYVVAGVTAAAGGVALVTAVVLFLLHDRSTPRVRPAASGSLGSVLVHF